MRGATKLRDAEQKEPPFQSTLLMRGATLTVGRFTRIFCHFNPRSSCEERPERNRAALERLGISIHAPHARSDKGNHTHHAKTEQISIHAPHARSDINDLDGTRVENISIHAPHARSDIMRKNGHPCIAISIHAPHARSDGRLCECHLYRIDFNPRSSCEERRLMRHLSALQHISIHAPHARSDHSSRKRRHSARNFNPRSSCEERLLRHSLSALNAKFQSTLLMRGATAFGKAALEASAFQSTLLMRGATRETAKEV